MKIAALTLSLVALVAAGFWAPRAKQADADANPSPSEAETPADARDGPSLATATDPQTVFQKAFWRRPQAGDKIIHAERREWLDTEGKVARWQWFLVLEPGPETRAWLESNPFLLAPVESARDEAGPAAPPEWFPASFAGYAIQQSPRSPHLQAASPDRRRLYATDWGEGFR